MNKIRFSHRYYKLSYGRDQITFPRLLQVFKCHYKDLSKEFIELDTLYWEKDANYSNPSYFKLPKTELIVLLFRNVNDDRFFTTVRRYTPDKLKYYKSRMGQIFEVEIKEKNERNKI